MGGPTRFSKDIDDYTNPKVDNEPMSSVTRTQSRLEFDMEKQVQFVHDRGIDILWEQSYICTCLTAMTKSPQPDCPICHGRGIAYLPPVKKVMMLQSQDKSVSSTDLGLIESGTATGTTVPNSLVSFRDRISVPEVSIRQSMMLRVNAKMVDKGYRMPYDVNRVVLARTSEGRSLELNKDYRMDINENILYPNEEFLDQNISINIDTVLRYIVIDLLKESRYQYTDRGTNASKFTSLPKKLLLRREDAWVNPVPTSMDDDYKTPENEGEWDDPKREMTGGFFGGSIGG